jgi:hypothetical protein
LIADARSRQQPPGVSELRWSHFLGQPAKVGSSMLRMTDHEDAETVFG